MTPRPRCRGGTVPELIAARAARVPDAVAVAAGTPVCRYGELVARAGRLARLLRAAGAGPEQVVGLCLDRGPEMVAAILGVWLAGAAYLPLDPGYPAGRLAVHAGRQRGRAAGHPRPGGRAAAGRAGAWRCDLADPGTAGRDCRRVGGPLPGRLAGAGSWRT